MDAFNLGIKLASDFEAEYMEPVPGQEELFRPNQAHEDVRNLPPGLANDVKMRSVFRAKDDWLESMRPVSPRKQDAELWGRPVGPEAMAERFPTAAVPVTAGGVALRPSEYRKDPDAKPVGEAFYENQGSGYDWASATISAPTPKPSGWTPTRLGLAAAGGVGLAGLAYALWRKRKAKRDGAKEAGHVVRHEHVDNGRVYDMSKLFDVIKDRPASWVPISEISGYNKSRRTGFSPKRLEATDLAYPVILDENKQLIDGRHRTLKAIRSGLISILARTVTPADMEKVLDPQTREDLKKATGKLAAEAPRRTAVVVKGNPRLIRSQQAKKFYGDLEQELKARGYDVSFDPGRPRTEPRAADLWVGHSRGTDRLRFAPPGVATLALGSKGGVNHPDDAAFTAGSRPTKAHFQLTPEMLRALDTVSGKPDSPKQAAEAFSEKPFPLSDAAADFNKSED